jgi:hypothetical protein
MSSVDWRSLRQALQGHIEVTKKKQRDLGINQTYVSKLLSGRYRPKKPTAKIRALCKSAGLNVNRFTFTPKRPRNAKALLTAAAKLCRGIPEKERALERLLKLLEHFEENAR